jgi:hypothetical protein
MSRPRVTTTSKGLISRNIPAPYAGTPPKSETDTKRQEPGPDKKRQELGPDTKSLGPGPDTKSLGPVPDTKSLGPGPDRAPDTEPDRAQGTEPDRTQGTEPGSTHPHNICVGVSPTRWNQIRRAQ